MNSQIIKFFIITTLILTLGYQFGVQQVYSLEDTFITSVAVVSSDTGAPTIPTNLSATVISTSEIDLSWTASTDDIAVAGYRIFRDSSIIASTTNTTYSDTGLIADTLYTYTVEAYDALLQYSGQSASSSATTLAVSTPSTPSTGGSSGSHVLKITDLIVGVEKTEASLSFSTNVGTISKVSWGKTTDYEVGSTLSQTYLQNHNVKISNLDQNTSYFFKIEVTNSNGLTVTESGIFTTNFQYQYAVPNVLNFRATPMKSEKSNHLTWNNPKTDFDIVRVVKSDKFYPRDPSEGEVIYEGRSQSFVDKNVEEGVTYYYSIFVKDNDGKYSSGAIAQARISKDGEGETSGDPFAGITIINNVHPDIAKLTLADFDFIQDGRKILNIGNTIAIDGAKNLTIVLDYNKVPEVLKTIAFSLSDPDDPESVFPFLLRVNDSKTAYEATIAPLGKSGNYGLNVIVLDYKNQGLKRLTGNLRAFVFGSVDTVFGSTRTVNNSYLWWLWLIVLVLILLVLVHLNRKRQHYEA